MTSYDKAIALKKDYADAHFNAAQALLTLGDYRRGFDEYEWRWRRIGMAAPKSRSRPLWRGEYPLARKTILLHAEQGLGDTIQFARYVPLIAAMGATVVLEVQPEVKSLLGGLSGAATVIARDEAPPPFDVHCPLGSLPLALKTELASVPGQIPYLAADEARVAQMVGASRRSGAATRSARLVGQSQPRQRPQSLDPIRKACSIVFPSPACGGGRGAPATLASRGPREGASGPRPAFISIQRDLREEDATALAAESRVTHIGDGLADFSDTAAVLALCDLVITVDTAVAHLAGAMGRPVWVLIPFAPDWRWTLSGETTPWYPTVRLFRQSAPEDWNNVLTRIAAALAYLPPLN